MWLIVCGFVTLGMYIKSYSFIKTHQPDIRNRNLKFLLVLVTMWIAVGVIVYIDNRAIQDVAALIGLVITLAVYGLFFVFKKFNGEQD